MANSNPNLLATQTIFSLFLLTFLFSINNVNSESFSVSFPKFDNITDTIVLGGDAKNIGGVLQLTKKDQLGKPSPHSFGLSAFSKPILLSDKKSGKVADFNTEFTFVVDPKGAELHGDGFTFFILSVGADIPDDESSEGGFLGLFNKETAFNTSKNSVVAVEFDTYTDEWDPNSPHIGIDINTIESSVAAPWPIDRLPQGSIGRAQISYESVSKELRVVVSYPNSPVTVEVLLAHQVDFAAILSDWVLFGFSAATGELAETHDILSWSFSTNI